MNFLRASSSFVIMSMAARGVSSIASIASSPVVNLNKLLMNTNDLNGEVYLKRLKRLNNHYVLCGSEKKLYDSTICCGIRDS